MRNKVTAAIKKYNMLNEGDTVLAALSGGADSVCLLHFLLSIKEEYHLSVFAVHVNHMLRGEEAQRDEDFCRELCEKYHVPLYVKKADIRRMARENGESEELCGRNVRYSFFAETAGERNAKIATAHTASDNLETVLYYLCRGTSLNGIKGIPPVRGNIIRPLLFITRQEVEAYCKAENLSFVQDSTNAGDKYVRNKIRHFVVPVLKDINPRVENAVSGLSQDLMEANTYLERQAKRICQNALLSDGTYSCEILLNAPDVILNYALVLLCKAKNFCPDRVKLGLCREILEHSGTVTLSETCSAVSKQGKFRIFNVHPGNPFMEKPLTPGLHFCYDGKEYSFKEIKKEYAESDADVLNVRLLRQPVIIRTRREGDVFTFSKRNVTKPLKKLMNEEKIPAEKRNTLLLAAIGSTVLWLEGVGTSKDGMPDDNAGEKIQITVREEAEHA